MFMASLWSKFALQKNEARKQERKVRKQLENCTAQKNLSREDCEFIFVSVLNIFPVSVKRRLLTADCGLQTADQG